MSNWELTVLIAAIVGFYVGVNTLVSVNYRLRYVVYLWTRTHYGCCVPWLLWSVALTVGPPAGVLMR